MTPQQGRDFSDAIRDAAQNIAQTALAQARREIQGQLEAKQAERGGLEAALAAAPSPARRSIQTRIDRLDREIAELEQALEKVEEKIDARTDVRVQTTTSTGTPFIPPPISRVDPTEIIATSLGILFIAFPLTLAVVRFIWKRSTSAPTAAITAEQARRFDRLEQSVDAIAIEVERISENQRYLTRLLAEPKQAAPVGSGNINH